MDISKIIGLEGGSEGAWFKILAEEGRGETKYYPAIVDGVEKGYFDFRDLDDYMAHKVEKIRTTIRLTVAGNAVCAEDAVRMQLGCHAMATGPNSVDVYPDQANPFAAEESARSLGRKGGQSTSPIKAEKSRENGKRGGRPKTAKE